KLSLIYSPYFGRFDRRIPSQDPDSPLMVEEHAERPCLFEDADDHLQVCNEQQRVLRIWPKPFGGHAPDYMAISTFRCLITRCDGLTMDQMLRSYRYNITPVTDN